MEGSHPLPFNLSSSTIIAEDAREDYDSDGDDGEGVPLSLSIVQVVKRDIESLSLLSDFRTKDGGNSYNEEWDEETDLIFDPNGMVY